jgi:hypothetical protein
LLISAQAGGDKRRVEISYPSAALALLKLRFDEHLFSLRTPDRVADGDSYTLFPQANRFVVDWQRNPDAARAAEPAVRRPPIESVVTAAHASLISTLEGRRILRLLYELQFEGARSIVFTIPARQTLEKVLLNGASVPFRMSDRTVNLPVTPSRAGDESARVELLVSEEQGGYALSGQLDYTFPACSWSVNDFYVTLNLPQVYNYKWEGGSLAPVDSGQEVEYTQHLPTPGKPIHLHQQLLSKAAMVRIAYTVDLSGSYYRGGGQAGAFREPSQRYSE